MMKNGEIWLDANNEKIQAHGGGMLFHEGVYFWYGEDKGAENTSSDDALLDRVDVIGIHCYQSKDLLHWEDCGRILESEKLNQFHDLHTSKVLERPKVIFCPKTQKFVLWAHVDSPDYAKASIGIAVSDNPTGPFTYLYSFRPGGHDSRDLTVFVDGNEAYVFFSSDGYEEQRGEFLWNITQRAAKLTDDFTGIAHAPVETIPGEWREAPAVFKRGGKYYQITSGCTGWHPNPSAWHVANHPLGPWTLGGDPCVEDVKGTTFDSQSTYVFEHGGKYVLMADRWRHLDLQNSGYVWLPIEWPDETPAITWQAEFNL